LNCGQLITSYGGQCGLLRSAFGNADLVDWVGKCYPTHSEPRLKAVEQELDGFLALLNQGMNANCASHLKVSLGLGFKNPTKEDSSLKSATPYFLACERKDFACEMQKNMSDCPAAEIALLFH
jgi:hypothetical protein